MKITKFEQLYNQICDYFVFFKVKIRIENNT
jgi:hypothetical protein